MITLGIETSCDETALALIETRGESAEKNGAPADLEVRVIDSLVHSQAELHSAYGGVFPNLAKREHGKNIVPLLHKLISNSAIASRGTLSDHDFNERLSPFKADLETQNPDLWESLKGANFLRSIPAIDRIAVTEGPGLEPTLWVGINFARVIGALWSIPIVPINHMEGHIIGSLLESDKPLGAWQKLKPMDFPSIALLISGGHTEIVSIEKFGKYKILGQALDDAVGEAFDKSARLLGLPYPGGPHISRLSQEAEELMTPSPVKLPRPMLGSGDLNFSFSGLKTAVLYAVREAAGPDGTLSEAFKQGLAHEFELAVSDTLERKLKDALDKIGAKTIIIGGGVSANQMLRKTFTKIASEYALPLYMPSRHISGDNALMIALVGAMKPVADTKTAPRLEADGTKSLASNII